MTDQQPALPAIDPSYLEAVGLAALALLGTRPRWKFAVHDGDRRRFGDRTPGGADLKIVKGNSK